MIWWDVFVPLFGELCKTLPFAQALDALLQFSSPCSGNYVKLRELLRLGHLMPFSSPCSGNYVKRYGDGEHDGDSAGSVFVPLFGELCKTMPL